MNRRLRALLRKEWNDLTRTKAVVVPMIITPVMLLGNFLPAALMMANGGSTT